MRRMTTPLPSSRHLTFIVTLVLCALLLVAAAPLSGMTVPGDQPIFRPAGVQQRIADFWHEDVPTGLRTFGLLADPPERVALRVVGALETQDYSRLALLLDPHVPGSVVSAHRAMTVLISYSGAGAASLTAVGPYWTRAWYEPIPLDATLAMPARLRYASGYVELLIWLRQTTDGWRVVMISAHGL